MQVLIADDHPIARRGLGTIVTQALPVDELHEAGGSADALALARTHRPELIITDMHMPGSLPARELCAQLRALLPSSAIVLVTAFERAAEIRDCLKAGATACLLKDTAAEDLAGSLRAVVRGQVVIDPRIAQQMAVELATTPRSTAMVHLTSREREVLHCLADGRSNRQIAAQLMITEATVKGYVSTLLEKLKAESRLHVVVLASKAGLL